MDAVSIRICIADDHLLIITGIRRALEDAEELEVVGVTQRGDEVLALVAEHRPDVVLLDHRMPGMDGLAVLKLIREQHPDVKVVMLSANENSEHVNEALALAPTSASGSTLVIWLRRCARSSMGSSTTRGPAFRRFPQRMTPSGRRGRSRRSPSPASSRRRRRRSSRRSRAG